MKSYFSYLVKFASAFFLFGTPLYAYNWGKAPLACLPERAVKWQSGTPEPCHCPPQSYCIALDIVPDDITFYATLTPLESTSTITVKFTGSDVPELVSGKLSIKDVASLSEHEWIKGVPDPVRDVFAPVIQAKSDINTKDGSILKTTLSAEITNLQKITSWINAQKMPLSFATRCCDSICPDGLTPVIGKQVIAKSVSHVEFTSAEVIAAKDAFTNILETTSDHIALPANATVVLSDAFLANNLFYTAFKSSLDKLTPSLDSLANNTLLNSTAVNAINKDGSSFFEIYNTIINLDLKNTTKVDLNNVMTFFDKIQKEASILQQPKQTITVDSLQCKLQKEYFREGCILRGTPITLADGKIKPIEELKVGDEVMGNTGVAKIKAKSRFTQEVDYMYSINGGKAFFTIEHPILTPKGWKSIDPTITSVKDSKTIIIGALQVGDEVMLKDNKTLKVKSIEKVTITEQPDAYNLSVDGDGSFIANGFIMKGFKQMQIHY